MPSDSGSSLQPQIAGPFSIGSDCWPGLAKVVEECGELMQVLGKLIATNGETVHYDGSDLRERVMEELADLDAAMIFFTVYNGLDHLGMEKRSEQKLDLFTQWHTEAENSA